MLARMQDKGTLSFTVGGNVNNCNQYGKKYENSSKNSKYIFSTIQ
jgi:hypothetical protein